MMVSIKNFGIIHSIFFSCSADEGIRFRSSSGGFIKSFLVYLLESSVVDLAIVTRTGDSKNPIIPETIITNSAEEILSTRTNAVYAVTNPLRVLNKIDNDKKYAFVGLPCHVRNLKVLQRNSKYRNIVMVISLFCHHAPDMQFTRAILEKLDVQESEVKQIEYRGNGWPGGFTVYLKNGQKKFISSIDYWSNDLNNGPAMCKYCSEIGTDADICVGDPWNLDREKTDEKGMSLVICRNIRTHELIKSAAEQNYIRIEPCSQKQLMKSQGYHIEEKIKRRSVNRGRKKLNKLFQKPKTILTEIRKHIEYVRNPDHYSLLCAKCYIAGKVPIFRMLFKRIFSDSILVWYFGQEKTKVNFGDQITIVLMKKFGYRIIEYCNARFLNILNKYHFCLLIVGSELHRDLVNSLNVPQLYIWGQGKGHGEYFDVRSEPYVNKVKIFAVRGPLTIRQLKLSETTPMGDPGFLMPLFFKVKRDPLQFKITYIPHHSNRTGWITKKEEVGADRYVDIMCGRRRFWSKLREIVSSRFVLTNSLHTAIICQAYGVPWALCLAKEDELNYPDKWQDLFEYLGIDNPGNAVKNIQEGLKWWEDTGSKAKIRDLLPMLASFPLPIKDKRVSHLIKELECN